MILKRQFQKFLNKIEFKSNCKKTEKVLKYEKTFRDRGSGFMTLEIIIILLTIVLAVYFLFRPTSKKEKDRFEDKDNWRGGF